MAMLKFSMYRKFLSMKPIILLLILLYRVCVCVCVCPLTLLIQLTGFYEVGKSYI